MCLVSVCVLCLVCVFLVCACVWAVFMPGLCMSAKSLLVCLVFVFDIVYASASLCVSGICLVFAKSMTCRKHLLKFSSHFTKGYLLNNLCTLDLLVFTFKADMLQSTIPGLTSRKHLLQFSGHSTIGGL